MQDHHKIFLSNSQQIVLKSLEKNFVCLISYAAHLGHTTGTYTTHETKTQRHTRHLSSRRIERVCLGCRVSPLCMNCEMWSYIIGGTKSRRPTPPATSPWHNDICHFDRHTHHPSRTHSLLAALVHTGCPYSQPTHTHTRMCDTYIGCVRWICDTRRMCSIGGDNIDAFDRQEDQSES